MEERRVEIVAVIDIKKLLLILFCNALFCCAWAQQQSQRSDSFAQLVSSAVVQNSDSIPPVTEKVEFKGQDSLHISAAETLKKSFINDSIPSPMSAKDDLLLVNDSLVSISDSLGSIALKDSLSTLLAIDLDSLLTYQTKVLDRTEVNFLMAHYLQEGIHSAVSGGVGSEQLDGVSPTVVVRIPMGQHGILQADVAAGWYTSTSTSNLNPFDVSGASVGYYENDDEDESKNKKNNPAGSPWVSSSGASRQDYRHSFSLLYERYAKDRKRAWSAQASYAIEYEYDNVSIGGGYQMFFNQKNTHLTVGAKIDFGTWHQRVPFELRAYISSRGNLNQGYFEDISILGPNGLAIDKAGNRVWKPLKDTLLNVTYKNSYALSFSVTQYINKYGEFSIFFDIIQQNGWLANSMQRIYFQDVPNYYIGRARDIVRYDSVTNRAVFHLADDIERLPKQRFKFSFGAKLYYYISDVFTSRLYYRYYVDDWGVHAHTFNIELPITFGRGDLVLYPMYRYYEQIQAMYFAPYNKHFSTDQYYTSDYDLSGFQSHQYGVGVRYVDLSSKIKVGRIGLHAIDVRYNRYERTDGLSAHIISWGLQLMIR